MRILRLLIGLAGDSSARRAWSIFSRMSDFDNEQFARGAH
jgi:hypothetical protein